MHLALEIQEILVNIFHHCYTCDLPSLARTCHEFKAPALDVLWQDLDNLYPRSISTTEPVRLCKMAQVLVTLHLIQTADTGRVGYPSKLHMLHPISRGLQ
ncbi:hypothetical protein OG21DRAFT_623623 [Imleria badia]|nr:hypothetical protein OG21DRAFT_623623 [Imleria badia]